MNEELKDIFLYSLTFRDIVVHLLISLLCGVLISLIYRWTYKGLSYSSSFVNSIIMLTMVMSVVIMVIGNNLATAFGLVGAMSIIRFRTAVKDSQDIMFIFFSLAMGLACGVGLFSVAIIGTIFIGIIFYFIVHLNFSAPRKREFLLQIIMSSSANESGFLSEILRKNCRKNSLVNVKAVGEEQSDLLELSYYIKLRDENNGEKMVREIKQYEGVRHVNLFFDEE